MPANNQINPTQNLGQPVVANAKPAPVSQIQNQNNMSNAKNNSSVLKPIDMSKNGTSTSGKPKKGLMFLLIFMILLLGAGSGYALAVLRNNSQAGDGGSLVAKESGLKREVSKEEITIGTKVGIADETTFRDSAEGKLEKGGINGEGSHKVIRPGGESQTVYVTSSVIDLDQFIGRKIKIWGETMASEKAGWFMDVGKLEVLE